MRDPLLRVLEKSKPGPAGDLGPPCLLWQGELNEQGYGRITVAYRKLYVHRLVWEARHGPIPGELCVMHLCDQPNCVELAHLVLGSNATNIIDRQRKGRQAKGSKNGKTLLTEEAVREIRRLAGKVRQATLAEHFGVSAEAVQDVIHRRTWRHIP